MRLEVATHLGGDVDYAANHSLSCPLVPGLTGLLKLAHYHADGFGANDTKLWLQLEWSDVQGLR